MPKGIHDSASDSSLILGHEMQITIHAPPGFDGSAYYEVAKGLMINTVEQASFGGLPYFQQRKKLDDGTIVVAVLEHGVQRVHVYPVQQDFGYNEAAIMTFRPLPGYPQAIIHVDKKGVIYLELGNEISAGSQHSQARHKDNDLLVSFDNTLDRVLSGGPQATRGAGNNVYLGGYVLTASPSSGSFVIGGGIVDGKKILVILWDYTSSAIKFYSHSIPDIDYSSDDFATPLVNWGAFTLEDTESLGSAFASTGGYSQYATMNEDGTEGLVSFLNGVDSGSREAIVSWTAKITNGVMSLNISKAETNPYKVLTRVQVDQQMLGTISNTDTKLYDDILQSGNETAHNTWQTIYTTTYPDIPYSYENADWNYTGLRRHGLVIDNNGNQVQADYEEIRHLKKEGTRSKTLTSPSDYNGISIWGCNHSTSIDTSAMTGIYYQLVTGYNEHIPVVSISGFYDIDYEIRKTTTFPWNSVEDLHHTYGNPSHSDWLMSIKLDSLGSHVHGYNLSTIESSTNVCTEHVPECTSPPGSVFTSCIFGTQSANSTVGTTSGTNDNIREDEPLLEYDLRLGVLFYQQDIFPFKTASITVRADLNSSYWTTDLKKDIYPPEADYTYKATIALRISSKFGDIPVPGLQSRIGNSGFVYDCTADDENYMMYHADPTLGTSDGSRQQVDLLYEENSIRCTVCGHTDGYLLYSLNDYHVMSVENNFNPLNEVTTVLTLFKTKKNGHIDIRKMYNKMLATHNLPFNDLPKIRTAGSVNGDDNYLYEAGVLGTVPNNYIIEAP